MIAKLAACEIGVRNLLGAEETPEQRTAQRLPVFGNGKIAITGMLREAL